MSVDKLSLSEFKGAMLAIADGMIANKDLLTQADQAIGDGDHGIGMARGFEAVKAMLSEKNFAQIEEVCFSTGSSLLASIGGASGAIFGSFFMGAAKGVKGCSELDAQGFRNALVAGLEMVKKRGGANIGDKTMVDALDPAVQAAMAYNGNSLSALCLQVYTAAEAGMELTKTFTAKIGKAKTLGERTLGFADPGSISITLIFKIFSDYLEQMA
jgi:phosphoenolpyruvate---glycerone phosphotransferase subunit DhaL